MSRGSPKFWSLTTLVAAALAIILCAAAATVLIAASGTAASGDQEDSARAQIIAASQTYLRASADADLPALRGVVCASTMAEFPGFPPERTPKELLGVAEIVVTGDTATGSMQIIEPGRPELPPALVPMTYVNEQGWKLCV